ncbi:hypothetical protein [Kingella kingae]|uniref:hypothetical protein n=1 Tax=Kingella kingae TaxID=504 RepID=UPI001E3298F7|nr:hypothetical protein [Kingella kingae]
MSQSENYRIVKSQLPLVGGMGGHNFIAVLDPSGKVVHELNGLATSEDGAIKPIGYLPSDRLKVYSETEAGGFFYNPSQRQQTLYEGSYESVMDKYNKGYEAGKKINDQNLPYPFFGLGKNSNSVTSTLLNQMGLDDPDLGNALTPGEGSLLLPEKNWCDPSDWKDWQDEVNRDGKAYGYDPLILNLDGKGIQTLAPSSVSARFDHNADGIATATGWAAAGNGILALDLNNNGKIDSGKEIFGNHSVLPNGTAAAHGYAALAELDSNADGIISALDDAFSSLKVWQDINQDGISQSNELFTLQALGIQSLNLEHQENSRDLGNGNGLTHIGSYTKTDGTTGEMGDVEFASNSLYSRYTDTVELTPEQLKAPNLQGLGRLRGLINSFDISGSLKAD